MKSLLISEFKAKCIGELKALQESGEELEITLRGKPLARVIPIRDSERQLGTQTGRMEILGDIIASDLDGDFSEEEAGPATRPNQR